MSRALRAAAFALIALTGLGATALAAPSVTVNQGAAQADPTSTSPILFDVVFSEPVTGLTAADFVSAGSAGGSLTLNLAGSGSTYTASISGMTTAGTVIVTLPAGAAQNAALIDSAGSTSTDNTITWTPPPPPTVTVNQGAAQADPTSTSPILFDVVFSEPVTGLTAADFVSAGSAGGSLTLNLAGSGSTYTASISGMTTAGTVIVTLPAGAAQNAALIDSAGSTSTDNTITWTPPPPPTVTVNQGAAQADPTSTSPILFDVVFSEPVTGLTAADFVSAGSAGGSLTLNLAGSGSTYTASISGMTTAGTVIVTLPAGAAQNAALIDSAGSTSTDNTITWTPPIPAPTIASVAPAIGPTAGGTSVTITGTNLTGATAVTVGGTAAAFVVTPGGAITATTPAHAAGAVDVVVTTPGGTATATNAFTYQAPGAVRFVVNNADDGSYVFTSPTAALNFTVTTSGGTGSSANITLAPGTYAVSFTTPAGTALTNASCAPSSSTVSTSAQTALRSSSSPASPRSARSTPCPRAAPRSRCWAPRSMPSHA